LRRRVKLADDAKGAVAELLAPMLKKTLFVAIKRVAARASEIEPFVNLVLSREIEL
jgi:hypothetical protein